MFNPDKKQIEHLISSDGRSRYEYAVKKIVDWEAAWGLYEDGWTMAEDVAGNFVFLLFPAKDFAELYAKSGENKGIPEEIPLDELMDELLPQLAEDNIHIGVFDVAERSDTPVVKAEDFLKDLTVECSKY